MNTFPDHLKCTPETCDDTLCWSVPRSPEGVGDARQAARETLRRWGEPAARTEQAALVLTELVTNSVQHGPKTATVWCRVRRVGTQILIAVWDRAFRIPAQRRPPDDEEPSGDVDDLDENGRGLLIVEALTIGWGVAPRSTGCVVWALM